MTNQNITIHRRAVIFEMVKPFLNLCDVNPIVAECLLYFPDGFHLDIARLNIKLNVIQLFKLLHHFWKMKTRKVCTSSILNLAYYLLNMIEQNVSILWLFLILEIT